MNLKAFLITLFVRQNRWHTSSVLGHTTKLVYQVIKNREYRFIVPALLHDIGKPFVAYQDETDKIHNTYSFTDHEEKSYEMIKNCVLISEWTKTIVRYHYLIRDMHKCKKKGKYTRYAEKKEIWDNLPLETKKELGLFLKYDDIAKKGWKEQ